VGSDAASVRVSCPAGTIAAGGTYSLYVDGVQTAADPNLRIHRAIPYFDLTGYEVWAAYSGAGTAMLRVSAICVNAIKA
jgi:hypothetical protein